MVVEYSLKTLDMLREILGEVDDAQVEALLAELERAYREGKQVFTLAAGRANLIMRTFAMRLMQLGFSSFIVYDTNTPALREGDLLIAGSGSGSTGTVVGIVKKAKKLGARVATITKRSDCELGSLSDAVVEIPTYKRSCKLHSNGSEFEQSLFVLCDTIGVELAGRLGLIKDISEIDALIQTRHANLQ